jgi:hypothetical protein
MSAQLHAACGFTSGIVDTAGSRQPRLVSCAVTHYILNSVAADAAPQTVLRHRVAARLAVAMWGVDRGEPHRDTLAAGDLALIYLGAPIWEFIGRAEVASAVHAWTSSEAHAYPGDTDGGIALAHVETWETPVAMDIVLARLAPSPLARADFESGVVEISEHEYNTVLAVQAPTRSGSRTGR